MKKITILILFFTINLNAQWNSTYPNLSVNGEPFSMYFINENIGFLGGTLNSTTPALTKTIDGGNNWTWLTLPTNNYTQIKSIYFSDINNGFISTDNQNINFKTVDGGTNWSTVFCQTDYPGKLYFKDSLNGFFYSNQSFTNNFSYTNNGGSSWTPVTTFIGSIESISFPNPASNVGYLMNSSGDIYKTQNNGVNWTLISQGSATSFFTSLFFTSELTGYRLSTSIGLEKTTDGGITWSLINQVTGKNVIFTNGTKCYVTGFNNTANTNEIYEGTDSNSGILPLTLMTGTNIPIFNFDYINIIQFPSQDIGYALSTNKILYKLNTLLGTQETILINPQIFPNPTNGILNISAENIADKKCFLIDLSGRLIKETKILNNQIDLRELQNGMYILNIEGTKTDLKIIKE
jgi:photosystem II stability/assembly factor-like uncharacterized protein